MITETAGAYDIAIANVQGTGSAPRSATVTIHAAPDIGLQQTATLEMLSGQQVAYRFLAQSLSAPGGQLTFQISGVTAGDYVFQLRIDGAASPLDLDQNGAPMGRAKPPGRAWKARKAIGKPSRR